MTRRRHPGHKPRQAPPPILHFAFYILHFAFPCIFLALPDPALGQDRHPGFETAQKNSLQARKALGLAHRFLQDWIARKDPRSALIRSGPDGDRWTVQTTATQLYPQMVLASWFTEPEHLSVLLRQTLQDEIRLTSRVLRLPDDYALAADRFLQALPDTGRIQMSAVRYAADGLSAITAVVGSGVWSARTQAIVDDLLAQANVSTPYADGPMLSGDVEINGNLLLLLPQLAGYTQDFTYLDWARRIGDVYCLGILPGNGGLPARLWDFGASKARNASLPLDEIGLPIVKGLALLFAQEAALASERAERYLPVLSRMFNVLLTHARTPEGVFFARIEPDRGGGYAVDRKNRTPAWPGLLAAALVFSQASGNTAYVPPVRDALSAIPEVHTRLWGNRPGIMATSLPDILDLYAFARHAQSMDHVVSQNLLAWTDREMEALLTSFDAASTAQTAEDESAARAALAYAWLKTAGMRIQPWQEDLSLGASASGDTLFVSIQADSPYLGRLVFDTPRHREIYRFTEPYPVHHGFPEWFAVDGESDYAIRITGAGGSAIWSGVLLKPGLRVALKAGESRYIRIIKRPHWRRSLQSAEPDTLQAQPPTEQP